MIIIQKPKKEDIEGIQRVFYETWLATYPNEDIGITTEDIEDKFKGRFLPEVIQKRAESVLNLAENQIFIVAKDGDIVVGVCRAEKKETYGELMAIYVLPKYQRNGIGKMFWEEVKIFFGNEKEMIVHVAIYNKQAINFYNKLGFVDTGKRFADKHKMPISGKFIPEMELSREPYKS